MSKGFLSNTTFNAAATILSSILFLGISAYSSRHLGIEKFGEGQYLNWFATTLWIFINLGIPTMIIRYVASYSAQHDLLKLNFIKKITLKLVLGILLIGIIILWIYFSQYDIIIKFEISVLFVVSSFQSYYFSIIAAQYEYNKIFKSSLIATITAAMSLKPFIDFYHLYGYLLTYILYSFVYVVVMKYLINKDQLSSEVKNIPKVERVEIVRFSFYVWTSSIISVFIWQRSELYFIERYLTSHEVAYFSISVALSALVTQPLSLLNSTLLSYFSRNNTIKKDYDVVMYVFLTKFIAWIAIPVCMTVGLYSYELLGIIYGSIYSNAHTVATILIFGTILGLVSGPGSSSLYSRGNVKFIFFCGLLGAVLAVLSGIVLTPVFGISGLAYTKVLIQFLMIFITIIYFNFHMSIKFPVKEVLKIFILSSFIVFQMYYFKHSEIFYLILSSFASLILYVYLVIRLNIFSQNEKLILLRSLRLRGY